MQGISSKKGTTTVGIKCANGVVIGAEKRAVLGDLIANKEVEKVFKIQDHIAMSTAGLVGDAQVLVRILRAQCSLYKIERRRKIDVESAATLLGNILQSTKYFPYWVQLLVGGYDKKSQLFSVDAAGGVLEEKKFVATGSGSPIAYGVLEDSYKEGMPITEAIPLTARALFAAMKRNIASGEGITIAVVDSKGYKKISEEQIKKYVKLP